MEAFGSFQIRSSRLRILPVPSGLRSNLDCVPRISDFWVSSSTRSRRIGSRFVSIWRKFRVTIKSQLARISGCRDQRWMNWRLQRLTERLSIESRVDRVGRFKIGGFGNHDEFCSDAACGVDPALLTQPEWVAWLVVTIARRGPSTKEARNG